jgi:hypothetical protein
MLPRAAVLGFALALAGCIHQLFLDDVHDSGSPDSDPVAVKDAAWFWPDGYCGLGQGYRQLTYTPRSAQIVILLDRSASMLSNFDGGMTRQDAAQSALVNAVKKYQARIKFGLEQFPTGPAAQCQPGTCCAGQVYPQPYLNNWPDMEHNIECTYPHGPYCQPTGSDSPSYDALANVYDNFQTSLPTNGDRYVLLVTSSEPSCAAENHNVCTDAIAAANALGEAGVGIVVLSLANPGSCLDKISRTHSLLQQPPSTQSLYTPNTVDDLANNLDEFFSAVARAACTMDSLTTIPPSWADLSVLIGNDQVQPADGNNQNGGWSANPNRTSITLSGQDCDNWVSPQAGKLSVQYDCSLCGGPNSCPPYYP